MAEDDGQGERKLTAPEMHIRAANAGHGDANTGSARLHVQSEGEGTDGEGLIEAFEDCRARRFAQAFVLRAQK
jgi:hypothetical protein